MVHELFLIDKDTTPSEWSVLGNQTIYLANGTLVAVGSLKPGDVVLSYNLLTKKLVPSTVYSVSALYGSVEYIINNNLLTDGGEDVLVNGQNMQVRDLKVGDELFDPLTGKNITVTNITALNLTTRLKFYDVNTEPIDDYIVGGYLIT